MVKLAQYTRIVGVRILSVSICFLIHTISFIPELPVEDYRSIDSKVFWESIPGNVELKVTNKMGVCHRLC